MLNGVPTEGVIPDSAQIMAIIEMEQQRELENIIEELEEENRFVINLIITKNMNLLVITRC